MEGMKALDDCFANSQRMMSKNYGPVSKEWNKASSDRCVVAVVQRAVERDVNNHAEQASSPSSSSSSSSSLSSSSSSSSPVSLKRSSEGLAYALAVAHLLKQRGDNRNLEKAFAGMEPPHLAKFAVDLHELMRKIKRSGQDGTKGKC